MNKLYEKLAEALEEGRRIEWLTSPDDGEECLLIDGEAAFGKPSDGMTATTITSEPTLLLIGAGHIGKALYDLATLQGMRTIVLDDRAEELTEERFSKAERHVGPFEELLQKRYAPSPYIVIFTHGHSYDLEALRYALSAPFSYLGMIGSKAKAAAQIETVTNEGFDIARIKAIHSPIGISINAVTPEEIAISIMAEIISTLRKDKGAVLASTEDVPEGVVRRRARYRDLGIPSIFMAAGHKERLFQYGNTLYVAGVVSDNFMRFLRQQKNAAELTLVIRDFTKMFATMEAYYAYLKKGGRVKVLHSSKLLAVCVNPLAPNGYRLDSDELREAIQTSLGVPAYDVRKMDFN